MNNFLSLKFLIFSPLIMTIIFLLPIFSGKSILIRRIAKGFALVHFLYSLMFYVFYDSSLVTNFETELTTFGYNWLGSMGISLTLGIDSVQLIFIILTSFLFFLACVASKGIIKSKHGLYYALIFLLETAVLGVFCSEDMFEFFLFWELELVPAYFLISLWGDKPNAKKSAMKFLLYTFFGSILMLIGFLMVYNFNYLSTSELIADVRKINIDYDSAPIYLQMIASILIFLGFAVKLPIIPLHTWLPDAHTDAATPISMLLAGILLKMGGYGIIKFNLQLMPDAFLKMVPALLILALVNIIFASVVAYRQTDIKKIIAYSSISVMGLVLLGLCSVNVLGVSGAIFLMVAHGIISAGLFFVAGAIFRRTKTRELLQMQGLANVMPRMAGFALIFVLSGIGVPLLAAFPGEFCVFVGAFYSMILESFLPQVIASISILVLVFAAAYSLKLMHGIFYGEINERWNRLRDVINHEFVVLSTLTAAILILGISPNVLFGLISIDVSHIVGAFGG